MKKFFSIALILFFAGQLCSQSLTVYVTYERYLSGQADVYSELLDVKDNGATIKEMENDKKLELSCEQIWGLTYKDELFRTEPNEHTLMMLVNRGKVFYYENGESNLMLLKSDGSKVKISSGWEVCFSLGLEDPLVVVPTPGPSVPKKPWL